MNKQAKRIDRIDKPGAESALWDQMRSMMQEELTSAQRASLGAQLLLERKRDKARLQAERDALHAKLQLDLFASEADASTC